MKFEDLTFIRLDKPGLLRFVPKRLFEQVRDRTFNIDKIYELESSFITNPTVRLYAMVDEDSVTRGVLWAQVNVITETIQVSLLSIDKEYQWDNALEKTLEFVRSWMSKDENLKIEFISTRPKAYEKFGFKPSKRIILESN